MRAPGTAALSLLLAGAAGVLVPLMAEDPSPRSQFRFQVVGSFDARHAGDTPGHVGGGGGVSGQPQVVLGDDVHGGGADSERAIGVVTGVAWDRLKQSLTVEFRPRGTDRIAVGDDAWLDVSPAAGPVPGP